MSAWEMPEGGVKIGRWTARDVMSVLRRDHLRCDLAYVLSESDDGYASLCSCGQLYYLSIADAKRMGYRSSTIKQGMRNVPRGSQQK